MLNMVFSIYMKTKREEVGNKKKEKNKYNYFKNNLNVLNLPTLKIIFRTLKNYNCTFFTDNGVARISIWSGYIICT